MSGRAGVVGLATNAAKAMSGSIVYSIAQTIALAIVTRSGGTEDAAHWFLAQALATPIAYFCSLRLKEQLSVETEPGTFLSRLARSFVLYLSLGGIATALWLVFASGQLRTVGIALLWANFAQQAVGAYQGRRAQTSQFFGPSQLDSLIGIAGLVAIVIGYAGSGLALGAVLTAISWWAIALAPIAIEARREIASGDRAPSTVPFSHDIAVGGSALAQNSQISVARVGARVFAGEAAIAAIGTASFFVRLGVLAVVGVRSAMGPRLARARESGNLDQFTGRVRQMVRSGVAVGAVIGFVAGLILGRWGVGLFFGDDVLPSRWTAGIVLASAVFLYASMILGQVLISLDRRWALARATTGALIATALSIAPLALVWGEEGAAVSLGIGYAFRYLFVDRALRATTPPQAHPTRWVLAGMAALLIIGAPSWILWQIRSPQDDTVAQSADAIVVLSGGRGERLSRALEIAEDHPDATIALSVPPHEARAASDIEVRELCDERADDEQLFCFTIVEDSTAGEAAAAAELIDAADWETVIVVTSDFHVSRSRRWFERCGANVSMAGAETNFADERLPREFAANVDALLFSRTCPSHEGSQ